MAKTAIYYLLMCIAHFCALPFLFILSFKQKYKNSLRFRFFMPTPLESSFKYHWFHACSFGEISSLVGVIEALEKELNSNTKILLTTTTKTGYNQALKLYPHCTIRYLPFESFIPLWLRGKKILTLTLLEAELWLMPLVCVLAKGGKTFSLNARISTRSFKKYLRFRFFYKHLFKYILQVFAQSKDDKERLEKLGAKNITILGNLKLDKIPTISTRYTTNSPLWIIASTHEKQGISEEELILQEILKALKNKDSNLKNAKFIFAPRHPERFLQVESALNGILKKHGFQSLLKTSQSGIQPALESKDSAFILLDSLGELCNLYAIASGVILGGSFIDKIGGHNPIEPAFFKTKLISGKFIFNQTALFSAISGYILCDISQLNNVLLQDLPQTKITKTLNLRTFINTLKG
ncbi:MAG: lipid IV(A) 3-deoxy-D-manno-octulosonic acid transferase [Helicobacter sp.]|nr:lipid IV(A) 3-deoxy-D-manno-octulosonic acid transferase [Helicobacteraceae bacterium]MDY3113680.1 lipid IV(A) 3-deoxy-D-manno-octulosonic acid transferase [Helicobacter sp.]